MELSLELQVTILGRGADEFDQLCDNAIRQVVVRQALAKGSEIDESSELAPVLRQCAAGAQVTAREMRFNQRVRSAFVAQEVANIGQRRTGNSELPVKNSGHRPFSRNALHQQISFAEVAMDEA